MMQPNVWLEEQLNRDYRRACEQEAAQKRARHADAEAQSSLWRRLNPKRS